MNSSGFTPKRLACGSEYQPTVRQALVFAPSACTGRTPIGVTQHYCTRNSHRLQPTRPRSSGVAANGRGRSGRMPHSSLGAPYTFFAEPELPGNPLGFSIERLVLDRAHQFVMLPSHFGNWLGARTCTTRGAERRARILCGMLCGGILSLCLGANSAAAQDTVALGGEVPNVPPSTGSPPEQPPGDALPTGVAVPGPIWVEVEASAYAVDEQAVRLAVAKELDVVISDSADGARSRARVSVDGAGNMQVHYQDASGKRVWRAVNAPDDPNEVPVVAALLLGNLARDQTSALLRSLEPAPVVEEPRASPPEQAPRDPEPALPPAETARAPLRRAPVNLALVYPLALWPEPLEHRFFVDLSLIYGRVGGVDALAVSAGVAHVERTSYGLQVAGVGNINHGDGAGVRAAGAFGYRTGAFHGLEAGGAAVIARGSARGLQVAGALGYQNGVFDGLQLAGAVGTIQGRSRGLFIAGGVHVNEGETTGLQAAGAFALATQRLRGLQLAPVTVAGDVEGVQFGIVNVGRRVSGLQLGVVNVADEVDGVSIGAVTYSKQGRTQAVAWYDSERPVNVGVRFQTGPLYAMPTFGYGRHDGKDEVAPGLSLGGRIPLASFFVDLDVNSSTPAPELNFNEHRWDLRYRALLGWQVLPWAAVFAGGGVLHRIETTSADAASATPIVNAGVQLL